MLPRTSKRPVRRFALSRGGSRRREMKAGSIANPAIDRAFLRFRHSRPAQPGGGVRQSILAGVMLLILGGALYLRGNGFSTRKEILELGDVKVTAPEEHTFPNWVAPVLVIGGVGLLLYGGMRKEH